jgi:hypothetical protein
MKLRRLAVPILLSLLTITAFGKQNHGAGLREEKPHDFVQLGYSGPP